MSSGSLAGFPVVDVRATLYDGSYHDVDSSVLAFQIAARGAFRSVRCARWAARCAGLGRAASSYRLWGLAPAPAAAKAVILCDWLPSCSSMRSL